MRTRLGNWFKRMTNLSLAGLYTAGLLVAGVMPVLLNNTATAAPNTIYSNTGFNHLSWGADRIAPSGGYTTPGDNLIMNVNGSATNANQRFYEYEGVKAQLPANTNSVKADLLVDSSWENQDVLVGMWGQVETTTPVTGAGSVNFNPAWPILEFNNIDPGSHQATVDVWNTFTGGLDSETTVAYGSTISLEIGVNPTAGTFTYYLNGNPIFTQANTYTVTAGDLLDYPGVNLTVGQVLAYDKFTNIIFDNDNRGESYTVKWSNLQTGKLIVAEPTNLTIKRDTNGSVVTNTTINDPNDTLTWTGSLAPGASWQIEVTRPDGTTTTGRRTQSIGFDLNDPSRYGDFGNLQGTYKYRVRQQAGAPNYEGLSNWSSPVYLTFDNLPPTITSISANGNPIALDGSTRVSARSGITFKVKAADPAGYGYTYVELNTAAPSFLWKAASTGAFDTTLVTAAGLYTDGNVYGLKICPTDKIGNGACTQVNFTVDNTRPTVTFTNPTSFNTSGNDAAHTVVIGGGQTLGIIAGDSNGISNTVLHVYNSDNSPALYCPVSNTDTTTCDLSSLGQGNYYVKAGATDTAGNNQTLTKYFTIDSTKPTVKVNLSRHSYLTNGGTTSSIQVPEIEAFDTHLSKIQVLKNGVEVTHWDSVTPGATTYKKINWLGQGTYVIRAYDAAGNVSDDFTVTIDNTAPNVPTNGQPSGNSYLTSNVFNYTWSDESESGAVRYDYQSSDSPSADNGTLTNVTWSSMAKGSSTQLAALSAGPSIPSEGTRDGHHYWQVRSVDAYGNTSAWSAVWDFTLDSHVPTVPSINTPLDEQYFKTSPISDSWTTSTDSLSGVAGYQIAYNYDDGHIFGGTNDCSGSAAPVFSGHTGFIGCRWVTGTQRNHFPAALSEQGGVSIWVRARDNAGNWSAWSTPVHYYYDATAPVLTYLTYNVTTDGVVPVITSDGSDYTYVWTTDPSNPDSSSAAISDPTMLTPAFAPTMPGDYVYHLVATDKAGNTSGLDFLFTIVDQNGGMGGGGQTIVTTAATTPTPTTPTPAGVTNVTAAPAVLGAQTATPNTTTENTNQNSDDSAALGDSTNDSNAEDDNGGGLAWYWWLLIALAAIGLGWLVAWLRSRNSEEN